MHISFYQILAILHVLGLDVGLGGCTVTYVISAYGFFKPGVMRHAVPLFKVFSLIIWVGFSLLALSGIGLIIVARETYGPVLSSWAFYLKMAAVAFAFLNGLYLNFIVTPAFEKAVELKDFAQTPEYRRAMVLGLIGGVISFSSWYGAFAMGVYVFRLLAG